LNAPTDNKPFVSVVLPVYNSEKYIRESVQSILDQTYENFELIIMNDGSKDRSDEAIRSITDNRIVYINQANMGLAATLNKAIGMAKGSLIARQDHDDLSLNTRLEKQVKFLNDNPETALLGTWAEVIDENGKLTEREHKHPIANIQLKFSLLFDNPFVHTSVMFRREAWQQAGTYSTDKSYFEDYRLWSAISRDQAVANLPEILVKYRELSSGMSKSDTSYAAKVNAQALENISFYCPQLSREAILNFLQNNLDNKEWGNIFNQIVKSFCEKEKVQPSQLDPVLRKTVFDFKRKKLNSILYSGKSGFIAKLKARIERKILFSQNKSSTEK
jgi:glycosyltransferase involved in cell wall biosynthesis